MGKPNTKKKRKREEVGHKDASSSSRGKSGTSSSMLLAANTSLGQHFLRNPEIVTGIVQRAQLQPTDVVLEVGPGTGNLTVKLLDVAKKVIAVEYDRRMVREVQKRVENDPRRHKLEVSHGDVLKISPLPYFDVCVANLPYQISSPFLFKLLAHRPYFRAAVVMFQEEFAARLSAKPGDNLYCRLTVNTQLLAKVEQLIKVNRNNFRPPPKVDSRVVRITLRNPPPPVNFMEWDGLVKLAFNRKNKTLRAIFTTKTILAALESSWKTSRALLRRTTVGGSSSSVGCELLGKTTADDDDDDDDVMEDAPPKKSRVSPASSSSSSMRDDDEPAASECPNIKALVESILEDDRFKEKRPAKMDIDDFLALLAAFNGAGLHFA